MPLHPTGAARSGEQINLSLSSCVGSWERFPAFWAAVAGLWHSLATSLLQAEPALERFLGFFFQTFSPSSRFQGKGLDGCAREQRQLARPGQVLRTLPPPPLCQRKHKHPTQRKHFSSATQVPIFLRRAGLFWAAFPNRIPGLSESPAELSGLGFGQSCPSRPMSDPLKPVNVTMFENGRGFKLA